MIDKALQTILDVPREAVRDAVVILLCCLFFLMLSVFPGEITPLLGAIISVTLTGQILLCLYVLVVDCHFRGDGARGLERLKRGTLAMWVALVLLRCWGDQTIAWVGQNPEVAVSLAVPLSLISAVFALAEPPQPAGEYPKRDVAGGHDTGVSL